jgi:hypothetical protein
MKNEVKGMPLPGVILLVFVILKLSGLINWSWIWVLSPFWIPFSIYVLIIGFVYSMRFLKRC